MCYSRECSPVPPTVLTLAGLELISPQTFDPLFPADTHTHQSTSTRRCGRRVQYGGECWLTGNAFTTGVKPTWQLHHRPTSPSRNAPSKTVPASWWKKLTCSPCLAPESLWAPGSGPKPPSSSGNAPGAGKQAEMAFFFCLPKWIRPSLNYIKSSLCSIYGYK